MGILFVCPTPIGNLEDITFRTVKTLKEVDLIACEDTRTSRILLDKFDIKNELISYHKFNYKERIPQIIEMLRTGKSIALISDAGMPGISDPGAELIRELIKNDMEFFVLPGASASIVALVSSGLDNERFTFIGFLSEKSNKRKNELEELKSHKETLIFYEAPHRIIDTLDDMLCVFGDRNVAICRELTKLHEEIIRDKLSNIINNKDSLIIKGEFVIVVDGNHEEVEIDDNLIKNELIKFIEDGSSKKDAVKIISEKYGLKKNRVYEISLEI